MRRRSALSYYGGEVGVPVGINILNRKMCMAIKSGLGIRLEFMGTVDSLFCVVQPLSLLLSVSGNLRSDSTFVLPKVIFRWWKISLRNEFCESRPGEIKESQEDFLGDSSLHIQIAIVFGAKVLEHVLSLCRGNYDFLEWLPVPLLLYIISFLELEDIARLSQVSRRFEMICNSNALWENIVENLCNTITPEMKELAQEMGWKKFFFTNRLQLQLHLRRRRQKQDAQNKELTE